MAPMRLLPLLALAAFTVQPCVATPKPTPPKFVTLDVPNARAGTQPHRINDKGQIVGLYRDTAHHLHGFLLFHKVYTTLRLPIAKGDQLSQISINNKGQIVGTYAAGKNQVHGFLLIHGKYTAIDYPNSTYSAVCDINDAGDVLGYYNDSRGRHGFLYRGGRYTAIDAPKSEATTTLGINDKDQIIGSAFSSADPSGVSHGFLLNSGIFTRIDPPQHYTVPFGISNKGQVVGISYVSKATIGNGFLWNNGKLTQIDFPNASHSAPIGINDHSQIVGVYWDRHGHEHGFLRNP